MAVSLQAARLGGDLADLLGRQLLAGDSSVAACLEAPSRATAQYTAAHAAQKHCTAAVGDGEEALPP